MILPDSIETAVAPLFEALPLERAMSTLVVHESGGKDLLEIVGRVVLDPSIKQRPTLQAGLWLYVDDLDQSHTISQGISDATGSFWHGIMHRREGDFSNSHYWFNRTGHHPSMDTIEGYDSHAFIDDVASSTAQTAEGLIALQRCEWASLFAWCAID